MPCIVEEFELGGNAELQAIASKLNHATAALCAISMELHRLDIHTDVIDSAQRNGNVSIYGLLSEHCDHDKKRLKAKIAGMSRDEKEMMREILAAELEPKGDADE